MHAHSPFVRTLTSHCAVFGLEKICVAETLKDTTRCMHETTPQGASLERTRAGRTKQDKPIGKALRDGCAILAFDSEPKLPGAYAVHCSFLREVLLGLRMVENTTDKNCCWAFPSLSILDRSTAPSQELSKKAANVAASRSVSMAPAACASRMQL